MDGLTFALLTAWEASQQLPPHSTRVQRSVLTLLNFPQLTALKTWAETEPSSSPGSWAPYYSFLLKPSTPSVEALTKMPVSGVSNMVWEHDC